jgi:hypothetical protein
LEKLLTNDSRFSAHYGEEARKILDYIKINAEENIKSAW